MVDGGASNTAEHAAAGPSSLGVPVLGRLAGIALYFFVLAAIFNSLGLNPPRVYAIGAVTIVEVSWYLLKRRKHKKNTAKAAALQTQLHQLKQQEFDLRYAEAKENGTLDRWEKT